jgi:hypothetical protein
MYKIKEAVREVKDEVSLDDNILTINGIETDLLKVELDENGFYTIRLAVDEAHSFMFKKGNFIRFFDINNNNIIEISELERVIDYINNDDIESIEKDLKSIMDGYLKTHTLDEWYKKGQ